MYITYDRNNMDKKSLIARIVIIINTSSSWNAMFSTTCNNEFAFIHICKIYTCLITPKFM